MNGARHHLPAAGFALFDTPLGGTPGLFDSRFDS
jgi:hypothetical protein